VLVAAREHVISKESDLGRFLDNHPLHHLYGGERAFVLNRYVGALNAAGFDRLEILSPLKSPINLFPYTIDTLRDAVLDKLSEKLPVRSLCRAVLSSDLIFKALLSMGEHFDNRPGRLYSFVGYRAAERSGVLA
jgi:hypothetical protein